MNLAKSDKESDRSIRESYQKVTERVPKMREMCPNSFCRPPFAALSLVRVIFQVLQALF